MILTNERQPPNERMSTIAPEGQDLDYRTGAHLNSHMNGFLKAIAAFGKFGKEKLFLQKQFKIKLIQSYELCCTG